MGDTKLSWYAAVLGQTRSGRGSTIGEGDRSTPGNTGQ